MKINISAILFLVAWPGLLVAQTKLKVAYPTTIGAMSVLWVTKEARLFEKNRLDVELIYIAGSSTIAQAMLAKEIPISELAM
jgi:ABC-type nitrate/sulfonate/bicarbonate transport system substrate-binding protein